LELRRSGLEKGIKLEEALEQVKAKKSNFEMECEKNKVKLK
jgi:hypothetical protein